MHWRVCIAGFGLLAGSRILPAESVTPLANTSQELREIRKEQGSSTQGSSLVNLRQARPPMQVPLPALGSPETPSTTKGELKGKKLKEPAKNWLVEGVNNLEKENKSKAAGANDSSSRTETTNTTEEQEEPDSLLKLYTEQKNQAEAEAKDRTPPAALQNNAFAPFLQNWLSNSRAYSNEKVFADSTSRKNNGVGADFQVPVTGQSSVGGDVGILGALDRESALRVESSLPPPTNPYLQALDVRISPDFDLRKQPSLTIPSIRIDRQIEPVVPNYRPDTSKQKVPPPARTDDQKYFPQLKKF